MFTFSSLFLLYNIFSECKGTHFFNKSGPKSK